ncbi:hypothetical protein NKR23_g4982 [Pleurostoma richardsiae]|uniref:YDG domain-containing protein n=1 Tax=Pleurostoma richardsiae TaxID=41990 RepID=A0AA38VUP4_9PEZI|nr:hypothetical protein NKR23_g4982 [Pleurostoma richardsiae]
MSSSPQPIRLASAANLGIPEVTPKGVQESMTAPQIAQAMITNSSTISILRSLLEGNRFNAENPVHQRALGLSYGLITWLEQVKMTTWLRYTGKAEDCIKPITDTPDPGFPRDLKLRALRLHQRWVNNNWEEPDSTPAGEITFDELFGRKGIMDGLKIQHSGNGHKGRYAMINKNYKQTHDIFGNNGLRVGQWFPNRAAALYHGAHGHSQGGISGKLDKGVYSIVISGYDDLDSDNGDEIWYSGSQGKESKTDQTELTNANKALRVSLARGNDVRVLRTSRAGHPCRPSCGVRYDGLYRVVTEQQVKNKHGALVPRWKLRRNPGQTPLNTLHDSSPCGYERRAFNALKQWEATQNMDPRDL